VEKLLIMGNIKLVDTVRTVETVKDYFFCYDFFYNNKELP
jgi:hypothetical protein